MVSNPPVISFLYMMAVCSNMVIVYGSHLQDKSDEDTRRGGVMDERGLLKSLVKPIMIKRENLIQSKRYPSVTSKNTQPLEYIRIPVEEEVRPERARNVLYSNARGGTLPIYQLQSFIPKTAPHLTRPKLVYLVRPRTNEYPVHVVYRENSIYPEIPSNFIGDVGPNRIPTQYAYLQEPSSHHDLTVPSIQQDGLDYSPNEDLWSSRIPRNSFGKKNRVLVYSNGQFSPLRTLPVFTGNELYNYPRYV